MTDDGIHAELRRRLRETLCELFDVSAAEMLASDAGIQWSCIKQSDDETTWFHILEEARKGGRLGALLDAALQKYSANKLLQDLHNEVRDCEASQLERSSREEPETSRIRPARSELFKQVLRACELEEKAGGRRCSFAVCELEDFHNEVAEVLYDDKTGIEGYLLAVYHERPDEKFLKKFATSARSYSQRHALRGRPSLVYNGEFCEKEMRRYAAKLNIELRTLTELGSGLIDLRDYLKQQIQDAQTNKIYPPLLYVQQVMTLLVGREGRRIEGALDKLIDWIHDEREATLFLVLGDFGTGKTFLMREMARRLGEEILAGDRIVPIPMLIDLKTLEKSPRLDALLAQHLMLWDVPRVDREALRHMIREGHVLLLFDGFDELALRVTFDRAVQHLDTLIEAVEGQAKVVISSRLQHFRSDEQVRTVLAQKLDDTRHRRVRLEKFTDEQKRAFFKNFLGDNAREEELDERMALLQQVQDLAGLGENPRMLSFIAKLGVEKLREACDAHRTITSAKLYEMLIEDWVNYELKRADLKGSEPSLSRVQLMASAVLLAKILRKQPFVTVDELEDVAQRVLVEHPVPRHDLKVAAFQIGTGSLLHRVGDGQFAFFHQSVMEWLLATHMAADWRAGRSAMLLSEGDCSQLTAKFLVEMVGNDTALQQLRLLEGDPTPSLAKKNTLQLRKWVHTPQQLDLHGQDLRDGRLLELLDQLEEANLSGCDLSGLVLRGVKLRGANLSGACLRYTDLTKADLQNVNATGADLMGARLTEANLDGFIWNNTRIERVSLVMARVDSALQDAVNKAGGAISGMKPKGPHWTPFKPFYGISFHKEGAFSATIIGNKIYLMETAGWRIVAIFSGHESSVLSVSFSPDGRLLASGAHDDTVRLWDVENGREVATLRGHEDHVDSVSFSPDGRLLASASWDKTVRLWEVESGREVAILRGHEKPVRTVSFSPRWGWLASGSDDATVRLWEVESGREVAILRGHESLVKSVNFSPDGYWLASASWDKTVRLWEMWSSREVIISQTHKAFVNSVSFSPDGRLLASGSHDGTVRLWEVQSGCEAASLHGHKSHVDSVNFSPDGRLLASASLDMTVRLWEVESGREVASLRNYGNPINSVRFSPRWSWVASGSGDATVHLWNVEIGRKVATLQGHEGSVLSVSFSPDGRLLASASWDKTVRLWEVESGREVAILRGHKNAVRNLTFSPDGHLLASASDDSTVRLWEVESGRELATSWGHEGSVRCVSFSPNGRLLASGSQDGKVRLWEVENGREVAALRGHASYVDSVNFSPDGRLLASASWDKTVRLWEVESGREVAILRGHKNAVRNLTFSPDGHLLASASDDSTVRLWEVASGRGIAFLQGHENGVVCISFSYDGKILATASSDGSVRIWDISTAKHIATLVSLEQGWFVVNAEGRFRVGGNLGNMLWFNLNRVRFEWSEIIELFPDLLLKDEESILGEFSSLGSAPSG